MRAAKDERGPSQDIGNDFQWPFRTASYGEKADFEKASSSNIRPHFSRKPASGLLGHSSLSVSVAGITTFKNRKRHIPAVCIGKPYQQTPRR